jgi:hypothetical protein
MFIRNRYYDWYLAICHRGQHNRRKGTGTYYEIHHIHPRSLGGSDTDDNLTHLTAREHFVAHHLLLHCMDGTARDAMIQAAFMMANTESNTQQRYRINSRTYERLRTEYSRVKSELMTEENTRRWQDDDYNRNTGKSIRKAKLRSGMERVECPKCGRDFARNGIVTHMTYSRSCGTQRRKPSIRTEESYATANRTLHYVSCMKCREPYSTVGFGIHSRKCYDGHIVRKQGAPSQRVRCSVCDREVSARGLGSHMLHAHNHTKESA